MSIGISSGSLVLTNATSMRNSLMSTLFNQLHSPFVSFRIIIIKMVPDINTWRSFLIQSSLYISNMEILQIISGIFNRNNRINASFIIQVITSRIIQPTCRDLINSTVSTLTKLSDWIDGKTQQLNPSPRISRIMIKVSTTIQPKLILYNKPTAL
ncbi:hypothetical protein Ent8706_12070 [Enterobacter kobei]|uniref:Uncharacterized protein n=1 Tax=Enterobacter cloacae TaxID=550 RepID=A0A6S5JUX1_ENTCL|nr:hypothetical protein AE42_03532 [Enterobacter kobei]KRS23085.1 hypothetical protein Ent8706_12070 [Enterobacter kobei]BBS31110.1 hypothetical protein WP5S18C02_13160 [Enterobacter cloacae]SAZ11744.1 Uncharacterised protein [Enterobacter kobei]